MRSPRGSRLRRVLLAAACLALALVPAGCATTTLWNGDDRTHEYDHVDGARVFHWPGDAHAIAVSLDDAAIAKLRAVAPGGVVASWLKVSVPPDVAEQTFERALVELWLVQEVDEPATWWLGERGRRRKILPRSRPTREACTVLALPAEPEWLGEAMQNVHVYGVVVLDDGLPFVARTALTPLAVVFDGACVAVGAVAVVLAPLVALLQEVESAASDDGR